MPPASLPHPSMHACHASRRLNPGGHIGPAPAAEAATSAVLAALPGGAKPSLRLTCRAARAAVDAHARRLDVRKAPFGLLSAAAAARMPLLQELDASADDTSYSGNPQTTALAARLRALAQGPAQLRRLRLAVRSASLGGASAVGSVVSALAGLTALTRLEMAVQLTDSRWSSPLVLPWPNIEVGAGCRPAGRLAGQGVLPLRVRLTVRRLPFGRSAMRSARPPGCQLASLTLARLVCCPPAGAHPPRVQELELTEAGCAALIPQALAQPSMPRLRSIKLTVERGGIRNAGSLASLCAAPWFSQLRELSLTTDSAHGSPWLAPLRAAPLLRKLCIQIHSGCRGLTDADGRALAAAALPELRELRLGNVGPGVVAALAAAPWLAQLESLDVEGGHQGSADKDGPALAIAPLTSITRLALNFSEPSFFAACAEAAWLTRLARVDLTCMGALLGGGGGLPEGSTAWAAKAFTALASLSISYSTTAYNYGGPPEASRFVSLVAAPWFGCLHHLTLSGLPLGTHRGSDGAGLRALAAAPLPNLTSLSLYDSDLSGADVSGVLSTAPWLSGLTTLALKYGHLGAPGHRALSRLHLPRLRALSLLYNGLDDEGLAALVSAPWLTQLGELTLKEATWPSMRSFRHVSAAVEDESGVFGRMRRTGCVVDTYVVPDMFHASADDVGGDGDWEDDG
jgi:hypothetical protein